MVSIELADELELAGLEPDEPPQLEVDDAVTWHGEGDGSAPPAVPTGPDNLVLRALSAVGRSARVRLVKRVPPGAGLGGGSSDAAAVLRWAGVHDLPVALGLGADVPFCLAGGRALVRGVGELVEPLPPEDRRFLLCTPPFGVSTALAYRAFDELGAGAPDPYRRNDLEAAALAVEPRLALWRDLLAEVSGHRPQLAGSGSTWYVELAPGSSQPQGARLVGELLASVRAAGVRAAVTLAGSTGPSLPR